MKESDIGEGDSGSHPIRMGPFQPVKLVIALGQHDLIRLVQRLLLNVFSLSFGPGSPHFGIHSPHQILILSICSAFVAVFYKAAVECFYCLDWKKAHQ